MGRDVVGVGRDGAGVVVVNNGKVEVRFLGVLGKEVVGRTGKDGLRDVFGCECGWGLESDLCEVDVENGLGREYVLLEVGKQVSMEVIGGVR